MTRPLEASLSAAPRASLRPPSERPHAQREVAARRAELIALWREAERAHGARMACERVQQRTRTQVPHAHAVVCAAREEDELLDRLDGERVHGEVGGAALRPCAERADALGGVRPDAPQADLAVLCARAQQRPSLRRGQAGDRVVVRLVRVGGLRLGLGTGLGLGLAFGFGLG